MPFELSRDAGASWHQLVPSPDYIVRRPILDRLTPQSVSALTAADGRAYAAGTERLLTWDSGGWRVLTSQPPGPTPRRIVVRGSTVVLGGQRLSLWDPKSNIWANMPLPPRIERVRFMADPGTFCVQGASTPIWCKNEITDGGWWRWTDGLPRGRSVRSLPKVRGLIATPAGSYYLATDHGLYEAAGRAQPWQLVRDVTDAEVIAVAADEHRVFAATVPQQGGGYTHVWRTALVR